MDREIPVPKMGQDPQMKDGLQILRDGVMQDCAPSELPLPAKTSLLPDPPFELSFSNEVVRNELKKLPALPTPALKEHPSLAYCEDRVIEHYKKLNGQTRGQAIVNYMSIVESLPTYGVHYYAVKDKQGIPWWLGLSYKGIFQYDYHDKVKPRKYVEGLAHRLSKPCQRLPLECSLFEPRFGPYQL
ncbi:ferm hypothetical protein [Limosa lapponica baueri]|uniref:FERM domain-containing protein n=1 Tax=Limosa lapponica baueri TaxID=1758121 RepID=A0A2I0TKE2_LIMLA|nr:ferm hypothetical protein [Limosa lapponica baueri]